MNEEQLEEFKIILTDQKCREWTVKSVIDKNGKECIGDTYLTLAKSLIDSGVERIVDSVKNDTINRALRTRN